ncbi:MAG: hypothetical protein U9N40_10255 [Euryarchaeota archaeon]|nr:hypothetical protein [Euryarchaeota archaeon]
MVTQMSFFRTHTSVLKNSHLQDHCLKEGYIIENSEESEIIAPQDFEFFNELVREYCGKDLPEISEKSAYKIQTSQIWEEKNMKPPEIFRIIIELLHLAALKDNSL